MRERKEMGVRQRCTPLYFVDVLAHSSTEKDWLPMKEKLMWFPKGVKRSLFSV